MQLKTIIATLLLAVTSLVAVAQDIDTTSAKQSVVADQKATDASLSLWDMANTAYYHKNYSEALSLYEEILAQGNSSAKLYYNLGNASFKAGELGRAILYYHRSLRLNPADEDTRYNLSVAESHTTDRIEQIPEFFLNGWMRQLRASMSGTAWSVLSLVMLTLTLCGVLVFLLSSPLAVRKWGFFSTLLTALLFVSCALFAISDRKVALDRSEAVVLSSSVPVKSSPDRGATDLFIIHEGTLLRTGESIGDWCEITIADGKKGWVESKHFETI